MYNYFEYGSVVHEGHFKGFLLLGLGFNWFIKRKDIMENICVILF